MSNTLKTYPNIVKKTLFTIFFFLLLSTTLIGNNKAKAEEPTLPLPNMEITKTGYVNTKDVFGTGHIPQWWYQAAPYQYNSYKNFDKYITYIINVENKSDIDAVNVDIRDTFKAASGGTGYEPVAVYFVPGLSSNSCRAIVNNQFDTEIICNLGQINAHTSKFVYVTVFPTPEFNGVTAVGQVINEACIEYMGEPTNICDEEDLDMADFSIVKTSEHTTIQTGEINTFTLKVRNNGTWESTNVQIFDEIPAGAYVILPDVQSGKFFCQVVDTPSQDYLWCRLRANMSIERNEEVIVTVPMRFSTNQSTQEFCNMASVRSGRYDQNIHNNTSRACVTVINPFVDLGVVKTNNLSEVNLGQRFAYTIKVKNYGNNVAENVVMTDTMKPYLEIQMPADERCTYNSIDRILKCNLGNINPGEEKQLTQNVLVVNPGTVPQYIENEACAYRFVNNAPINDDRNDHPNCSTDRDPLLNPVLNISKIARINTQVFEGPIPYWWYMDPNTYNTYQYFDKYITYELTASNTGNGVAYNVSINDKFVPARGGPGYEKVAVKFVPDLSSSNCSVIKDMSYDAEYICDLGDINPGQSKKVYVTVVPYRELEPGIFPVGQVINNACLVIDGQITTICDNQDIDMVDFEIVKSGPGVAIRPGGVYEFTLTIKNNGPYWNATNVQVFDKIPVGAEVLVSQIQSDFFNCQVVVRSDGKYLWCRMNGGSFDNGQVETIKVPMRFSDEGHYCNISYVRSGRYDWKISNNTSTHCMDVIPVVPTKADVVVEKSVNNANPKQGDVISYTLNAINLSSTVSARNVVITDTIPQGVEIDLTRLDSRCSYNATTRVLTCSLGDIVAGGSVPVVIYLKVNNDSLGTITNIACVVSDNDSNPDNNCDDAVINVVKLYIDLAVSKTNGVSSVKPGDIINYTITVRNNGNGRASNMIIVDGIPELMTYLSDNSLLCSLEGTNIVCRGINLEPGESFTFVLTLKVLNSIPAGVNNVENMSCAYSYDSEGNKVYEPDFSNNCAKDTDTLNAEPDLMVVKSTTQSFVNPGDLLIYTLYISNKGNQGALGIVITETLPKYSVFDAANSSVGWVCNGVVCTYTYGPELLPGQSFSLKFAVIVNKDIINVKTLSNGVIVADNGANGSDPTPDDNKYVLSTDVRYPEVAGTEDENTLEDTGVSSIISLIFGSILFIVTFGLWFMKKQAYNMANMNSSMFSEP